MTNFKISMKAARINSGKTQDEVAKALHVSRKTVASWERGTTSPTVEKAKEFCSFCNVPYDVLSFLRRSAIK